MPWRLLLVLATWSAIFLPALGSLEIKGEEGRRILPAVQMLETGDFLVPRVGSEPYLRKPPLINWLIAGSFELFGVRNEWTARLPSALGLLAVAVGFLVLGRRALGQWGSLAGALMWLTCFGMVEKGRLAEIEALYVSLSGLAFLCWLFFWWEGRSRWWIWLAPAIFLGLGLLTKGPLHLLFFYSLVAAVLWRSGELSRLWSLPHLVALLVMLGIFAAWAVPCLLVLESGEVAAIWTRQATGRISAKNTDWAKWALNIPKGILYLLPWAVLLPAVRWMRVGDEKGLNFLRGLVPGLGLPFLLVCLLPGGLPRYTMPLLVPAVFGIALALHENALVYPRRAFRAVFVTVAIMAVGMILYAGLVVPRLQARAKIRPWAARMEAVIPPGARLVAVDPDYQPYLFYLSRPITYVSSVPELPVSARYVLVERRNQEALEKRSAGAIAAGFVADQGLPDAGGAGV